MLWCRLISIGVILVGSGIVNGCSGVGLVVQRCGQVVVQLGSHGLVELIFCLSLPLNQDFMGLICWWSSWV